MTGVAERRLLAGAAGVATIGAIALFNRWIVRTGPSAETLIVVSACVAIAALAWVAAEWPRSRARIAIPALAASLFSLAVTLAHEPRVAEQDAFWIVAESFALFSLAVVVVRWSPRRTALLAGGAVIATTALTFLRVTQPAWSLEFLGAFITWAFGAVAAAGFGLYLRVLDEKRARMIDDARRAQRLEVARDLHDFVAHDVTGMVVQAQAANLVAQRDPQQALSALARIEEAGLRALGSLDHTVQMLGHLARRDEDERSAATAAAESTSAARNVGVDDLLALVGRFAATDARTVRLHADIGAHGLPAEVTGIAYRVLAEALTNVRRHAAATASVDVSIVAQPTSAGGELMVRVANANGTDATPALPAAAERGGQGLRSMAATVQAAGGSFSAAELAERSGWQLTAVLPLKVTRP
jgi:signal transduction histidine kinase